MYYPGGATYKLLTNYYNINYICLEVGEAWLTSSQSGINPSAARSGELCMAGTVAALWLGTCRTGAREGLTAHVSGRMGKGRSE